MIISSNNKLHVLIRRIKKEYFKDLNVVKEYKEYIFCDHVLQDNEYYMFVRNIDDAIIIE